MENTSVETKRVESKLYIKLNEEADNVDFTLFVPQNCNYENAKKGALGAYEHIVRLENEAIRLEREKAEKEAMQAVAEPVETEPVETEPVETEPVTIEAEVAG